MRFNEHYRLKGAHAFLSASGYHWVNYSEAKLLDRYVKHRAAARGTELHAFASESIRLGVKLEGTTQTLTAYVNDAIGFKMTPEQVLYYSENCFGTADAIGFRNGLLRIHDYKSGETPAKMTQLDIYAALFCLEYEYDPSEIDFELRIYQSDAVAISNPEADHIRRIMSKIVIFDRLIKEFREEQGL